MGVVLHVVAEPGGKVAFGVGPGHEVVHVEIRHGIVTIRGFGGRDETEAGQTQDVVRQGPP